MDDRLLIILILISVGALEIIMGIPLLLEKIKPNWLYGFRIPKTLSNEKIWYECNKYMGRDFIVAGTIVVLVSIALLTFVNIFSLMEIIWIEVIILLVPIIIILIRGFIYLKKFED